MKIALWIFPEVDFADWCKLVGNPQVPNYCGYIELITATQADQERQGREVTRVHFTVAEMIAALNDRGFANTPDNRAAITALRA